jgi:hypothetical protein
MPPTLKTIIPMFGPTEYTSFKKDVGVLSIAEATFRFIHGEITEWWRYKELMDKIMNRRMTQLDESDKRFAEEYNLTFTETSDTFFANKTMIYTQMANERLYNKTPIEMFVALETAIHLAHTENPDVAFRNHLKRCFLGLLALQQSCGPWIDVSDEASSKYGLSDLGANIASSCMWFPTSFYAKTVSTDGTLSFAIAPVREFVAKRERLQPLTDSVLFDYIQLLFPATSAIPRVDANRLRCKVDEIQARIYVVEQMHHHMTYRYGTYGTCFGIFEAMSPNGTHMRLNAARLEQRLLDTKENINVIACMSTILYCGTREAVLDTSAKAEIAAADAVMIPFVTIAMNKARSVSAFWL